MTKIEFQKRIDRANRKLLSKSKYFRYHNDIYNNGVCDVLSIVFDPRGFKSYNNVKAITDFTKILKPKYSSSLYWLGERNQKNLERRQIALRLFEQYAIDNKLYKEY